MLGITDSAWKFGCGRYIQEINALKKLDDEIARCGKKPYFLTGTRAWNAVKEVYPDFVKYEKCAFEMYSGFCTEIKARELAIKLVAGGYDVIVGFGGGRNMDLCKLAADIAHVKVISVPTVSATAAAFTPLSVVYNEKGSTVGSWYFENEVSCVIADTTVLSRQPMRYCAAGIMDSLAKACEIAHHGEKALEKPDLAFAYAMGKHVFGRLFAIYKDVLNDINDKKHSEAVEEVVYLIIAATGMISGTAKGSFQSAVAHALYEVGKKMYPEEMKNTLHGEAVGLGLKYQTEYTGIYKDEIGEISRALGIPARLEDVGIDSKYSGELCENMVKWMERDKKVVDLDKLKAIMAE